jgi:glutaredoxin
VTGLPVVQEDANIVRVELYTRRGCGLCDEAKEVLERVRAEQPFELVELDIDEDAALRARYDTEVPVIWVGGRKAFKYRVEEAELRRKLAQAAGWARP